MLAVVQIMERNYKQDGDAAQPIELGDTARDEGKMLGLGNRRDIARVKRIH